MVSQKNTYFMIPFEIVPRDPPYRVWFAAWTAVKPRLNSDNEPRPFVIGVAKGSIPIPRGAMLLGTGRRGPDSVPPPPPSPIRVSLPAYQEAFGAWLQTGSDAQDYTYFTIPFDGVPETLVNTKLWFATWSPNRPEIVKGMYPPLVVGVVGIPSSAGATASAAADTPSIPQGATILATGTKDPPIPPPAPPPPGTSLDGYTAWLDDRTAE
jgi:hypothetical protein